MRRVFPITMVAAAATLGSMLSPALVMAQPFEGSVTMRASAPSPNGPQVQDVQYLVRGGKVRVSIGGPVGGMSVLSLPAEKKVYVLMAAQSAYMEMPLADASARVASQTPADVKVTRTGRMETIAGYACEHVTVVSGAQSVDVCMAKGLGDYVNPLAAMQSGSEPAWQRTLAADGGFPLRITMPDGSIPMEAVKVERKKLANDLFSVPLNYVKMDMPRRR